jgi:outer membrane receptor protein involved in Fe transport
MSPVHAQQEGLEEVTVTGSRIVQRDFVANSPIVSVESEFFDNTSTLAVETVLNQLPQFVPAVTQFVTADVQPSPTNTTGANTISLRGLGANRNLVLIDGRRAQPVNALLTVDTNTIPSAAIQRVEVVTGGASATYGADAISGVVNFIMKKNFEGIEVDVQTGWTEAGDGEERRIAALFGANVDNGRGNVMIGLERADREAALQNGREFFDKRDIDPTMPGTNTFLTSTYYTPGANQPSQAVINAIYNAAPGPLPRSATHYFNRDGTAYVANNPAGAYRYTDGLTGPAGLRKIRSDGTINENQQFRIASTPLERYSIFGRGHYGISDDIELYVQGNYVQSLARTYQMWSPAILLRFDGHLGASPSPRFVARYRP